MKLEIFKFDRINSTNDTAMELIKKKKKKFGCVYADVQARGRGTQGKKWVSEMGNLFVSIFFPLKNNYPPFNEFSIINPVIVSEVINKFCAKKKISFKFPNDVLVSGRKICGILQEVIYLDSNKFLIVGIGINIISNPNIKSKYKATNIYFETKKKPKVKDIIYLLVKEYENFFYNMNSYNFINFKTKANLLAKN